MKRSVVLFSAVAGALALGGCVAVPVQSGPPVGVYRSAPVVVQAPPVVVRQGPPARGWRDHDRDGVPDRHDRRPNNPYRY